MAWLTDSGLLVISLVALITGLVTGLLYESVIRKRLGGTWIKRLHLAVSLAPFLLMISASRFPFSTALEPPSLAEEQAVRSRLLDMSLPRVNSQPFRSKPFHPTILNPPVQTLHQVSPQSSEVNPVAEQPAVNVDRQEIITRLVISSLGVDNRVRHTPFYESTWDLSDLNHDIAWLEIPAGWETSNITLLAGHVTLGDASNGPFRYLFLLTPGEQVKIFTPNGIRTYSVTDQKVVNTNDLSIFSTDQKGQLILLTCTDWDELSRAYRQRRVVFADLVAVEPLPDFALHQ